MIASRQKINKIQLVTCISALLIVAGCDLMPTEPEGINSEGMTRLGDQMRKQGDDSGAANFYMRSLQRVPNNIAARKSLAEILEAHSDLAGAAEQYQAALAVEPENGDLLRAYGRVLIKQGNAVEAKNQYEKALRVDSDDVKALNGLGISLDYLGNHAAAQKAYKEALDEDEKDIGTLSNLAHSYVLTGAYDDAIALLEPHMHDKTATAAMRQNLAEAYGMNGMDADAERVGRMDLSVEQVKHNLDFYRAQRKRLALSPGLYADLGSFATQAIAEATVDDVKTKFPKEVEGLVVAAKPEVKEIGGTPSFAVRATGFVKPEKVKAFCEKLKKASIGCKVHS